MGVICTAYSNGAFFNFIKKHNQAYNIELIIAKTGVKYLTQASEKFDIGLLFEANGHGKISQSTKVESKLQSLQNAYPKDADALDLLMNFLGIFNPTVGDAITLLLAVEFSLYYLNFSIQDFSNLYAPLNFIYGKLKVKNKNDFKCNEDETRLIQPSKLQNFIDEVVNESNKIKSNFSRCFVRPSGTEDALRVYCESSEIAEGKTLLGLVEDYIKKHYC